MIGSIAKIIVKSMAGIIILVLLVESSLILPCYFSMIFNAHAMAAQSARENYLDQVDIDNFILNVTKNNTNDHISNLTVTTQITDIGADGNTDLTVGDDYGNSLDEEDRLQRGDIYTIHVEMTYNFLTPEIAPVLTVTDRRAGVPIEFTYDVPVVCLEYIKEID